MLEIHSLSLQFGRIAALADVTLSVDEGTIFAVIGPNGAGKSSLFNCINGIYHPNSGSIHLRGQDITSLPSHRRARLGIGRTFQNLALFEELTVLDNLMAARYHLMRRGSVAGVLYGGPTRREELRHRMRVEEVIDFFDLAAVRHARVSTLPYGSRKRVELARAVSMDASVLLLDEPMAGMSQEETESIARYVLDLKEMTGVTQVLVEHNLGVVLDIADRVAVLDYGQLIAEGVPDDVVNDPAVRMAYVGDGFLET